MISELFEGRHSKRKCLLPTSDLASLLPRFKGDTLPVCLNEGQADAFRSWGLDPELNSDIGARLIDFLYTVLS